MRLAQAGPAIAALLWSIGAFGAVYRCEVGGKITYSDKPCPANASSSLPVSISPAGNTTDPRKPNLDYEANMGRVAVGMTPAQVERAWGRPKRVNSDVRNDGKSDQLIYERDGVDAYVYLKNGIVTSISTQSSTGSIRSAEPLLARAPTRAELEAKEREDKAGERRFVRPGLWKDALLKRVGEPDDKQFRSGLEYWTYFAARLDPQTVSRFVLQDDRVVDVERNVSR